ncbi:hypothetical protein TRIATDRAFT_300419 [Trichoderma atroviride IMI 206040]|uniref:Uncharacterized protein n=1 Tax=Hypocrea atroviridis (strain ATCC 20476 / IMI 206040) TaxID=452589 RepID=G9P049_HYPAI|nr:uncharacterized protein TRIATDRAFT_300419 [Trichoderma atroviride IMI 206040]EHK44095.1 hypothetical protein TRIATDRAFT_300419 [Trichoderma atroviride IMI 206040]
MRALELPILARETPWRLEGLTKRATIESTTIDDLIWKAKDQKKKKRQCEASARNFCRATHSHTHRGGLSGPEKPSQP